MHTLRASLPAWLQLFSVYTAANSCSNTGLVDKASLHKHKAHIFYTHPTAQMCTNCICQVKGPQLEKISLCLAMNVYVIPYICVPLQHTCECLYLFSSLCASSEYACISRMPMLCVCVSLCVCGCVYMAHSSCRYFISLLWLGEAGWLGMHCDSYNLTNWDGGDLVWIGS